MRRESYHVTLAFLGDIGEATARELVAVLDEIAASCDPVPLVSEGLGRFGRGKNATLWLGIAAAPELQALAESMRDALRMRGIAYDEKPFRPHITLARRATMPAELPPLSFPRPDRARRTTLFKSTLTSEGALYKPLYTVVLGRGGSSGDVCPHLTGLDQHGEVG